MGIIAASRLSGNQPNFFIGNYGDILTNESETANFFGVPANAVENFKIENNNISFYLNKPFLYIGRDLFRGDKNITYLEYYGVAGLAAATTFRDSSIERIILPNASNDNILLNSFWARGCNSLAEVDLQNLSAIPHNFIGEAIVTELNFPEVTKISGKGLRRMNNLHTIRIKKCKEFGGFGMEENNPIFDGLPSITLMEMNSHLLTSNNGGLNFFVQGMLDTYSNLTINFYDDNNNFISTL
jgi:hypothetical protein